MVLLMMLTSSMAAEPNWGLFGHDGSWNQLTTRESDVGPVEVFHRVVDDVNCFQAHASTDLPPEAMLSVVADVESAPRWSTAPLPLSKTLANKGNAVEFVQHVDVPDWTLANDRFWVLRGEPGEAPSGKRFRWTRVDAAANYPEVRTQLADVAGAIEVPVNWGEWHFESTGNSTRVHYHLCTDAGGVIPTWLQKVTTRQTLPDVVATMIAEALRRRG